MIDENEKKDFLNIVLRTFKTQHNTTLTVDNFELIIDKKTDHSQSRFLVYTKQVTDNLKFHIYFKRFGLSTIIEPFRLEIGQNYYTGLSGIFFVSNCELNEAQFPSIKRYLTSSEFKQDTESTDYILFEDDSGVLLDEETNDKILLEV